ncbi:hypothetical protein [Nonomuraea basaltis]|uniref:hypothetical protein n=1 Tax=Nonomuraea basaltis TaxID=2495887 RepID=UPI00110C7142|nr:hypothetical protein [Nonomuraea basaltis]TMR97891.1 hypothetical protein EJK15_15405 [Nonomuraea basaltis]
MQNFMRMCCVAVSAAFLSIAAQSAASARDTPSNNTHGGAAQPATTGGIAIPPNVREIALSNLLQQVRAIIAAKEKEEREEERPDGVSKELKEKRWGREFVPWYIKEIWRDLGGIPGHE